MMENLLIILLYTALSVMVMLISFLFLKIVKSKWYLWGGFKLIKKYKKILLVSGIVLASVLFAAGIFLYNEYKKFDPEVGFDDDFILQEGTDNKRLDDFITKYNNEDMSEDDNVSEGIDAIWF